MEQFNVISILGADARVLTPDTDVAQATRDLNRKSLKMHGRHALSWLLRAAAIAALYLLGRYGMEGTLGGAMSMTAMFASAYLLWYIPKGHLTIQSTRQARLYWIMNDAGNRHETFKTDPLGVEVRTSAFGFNNDSFLGHSTFYRYRITNRSSETIDSMFVGRFSDPDLGDFDDDRVGTDTTLSMVYTYNADNQDESDGRR